MGLFGTILKAIPGVIGSAASAISSKKAVGHANDATQLGITNAKGDLNAELARALGSLEPYTTPGALAFGRQSDILGLNGDDAQAGAISGIHDSPLFQALFNTGRDSALAAASATGGIRGGNVNQVLAQNGENAFATTLQQLMQDLGGISNTGLGATELGANLGANTAGNLASLDTGSGQANAGAILGKQGIDNTFYSGLRAAIQQAAMAGAGGVPGGGAEAGAGGGGFDLGSVLKKYLGGGGLSPDATPLSGVSGGGFSNAIPTGYKF